MRRCPNLLGLSLILLMALSSCGVKVDLPTASDPGNTPFGAGDTSFIRISPDWDGSNGYAFEAPWDIIVGQDGYIFIADKDAAGIRVVSAAGVQVTQDAYGNDFSPLSSITDPLGDPVYPNVITQDTRLNLFISDSSNRLMVWNQYFNNVGIDSMATGVKMRSPADLELWVVSFDSILALQTSGWSVEEIRWSAENLEQWLAPRVFWDASDSLQAIQAARYYIDPHSVAITGVSCYGEYCYVADAGSNTILGLAYRPVALLMTGQGQEILAYGGTLVERTVSNGTGNGTVNDPRGMTHDQSGAMLYTQWGENFAVHKVGGSIGFEYGEDDIMEIERYRMASDVCVDPLNNIYVADTGHNRIQQFTSTGRFAFNVGLSQVLIDSTYLDSTLVDGSWQTFLADSTYRIEVADILDAPRAVAVDANGVVYIADTGNQRVMRFRLSTELDYSADN